MALRLHPGNSIISCTYYTLFTHCFDYSKTLERSPWPSPTWSTCLICPTTRCFFCLLWLLARNAPYSSPHFFIVRFSKAYERGSELDAFKAAVIPGLPALLGTIVFVVVLAVLSDQGISSSFLWLALVTVWALTVPHMIVTAKLDRAAFKSE